MSSYPSFGGAAARPCMRCGAPIAFNESQCSRCGLPQTPPSSQPSGMFQQGQQARPLGPSWSSQPPQASPFAQPGGSGNAGSSLWPATGSAIRPAPQQNMQFPGQNQPSSQPLQQNLFGTSGVNFPGQQGQTFGASGTNFPGQGQAFGANFPGPNQSALNKTFGNFQQQQNAPNRFFTATQQNGYGTSSLGLMERATRRQNQPDDDEEGKKPPSVAIVALIIVLLLAVVGGGGFVGFKLLKHSSNTVTNTPTPVAISTPTGTPIFSDSFKNGGTNWDTNAPAGTKFSIANGQLIIEADTHSVLFPKLLLSKTFADFRIDVDAALAKGDTANGYGIYIRASSTQDNALGLYYRFEVYGDGSFWIYKGTADANGDSVSTAIKQSGPNNAIYTDGTLNHLTIIAKGSQLSFIVNNTTVSTFTDTSYQSGSVALFVSNIKSSTTNARATFENFAVFPAQ